MKRVIADELLQHVNQPVEVCGWLNNVRAIGKVNFLILRDRSGLIQVVIQDKNEFQKVAQLQPGSILSIRGQAIASAHAELGVEVINPTISVEVAITDIPPIEYYKPKIPNDLDFILDHRPIALRNREIQAIFVI